MPREIPVAAAVRQTVSRLLGLTSVSPMVRLQVHVPGEGVDASLDHFVQGGEISVAVLTASTPMASPAWPAYTALARMGYRIDRNRVTVCLAFTLDEWADDDVAFTTRLDDDEGWATGLSALCEALKEKTPSALALPLTCARPFSYAVH